MRTTLYYLGGILLIIGAALPIFPELISYAPITYSIGALLFAAIQISQPFSHTDIVVKRLRRQQILGSILLVAAGGMMFMQKYHISPCTGDEWMIALAIGAFIQLYTSMRMPRHDADNIKD